MPKRSSIFSHTEPTPNPTNEAIPELTPTPDFAAKLPDKAIAYLITKADIQGDLYHLTRVYIEKGRIVFVAKEDPNMKIIVADHIAGELLR